MDGAPLTQVDEARVVRVALDKTALRFDGRVAGHCLRDLEASIGRDRAHDEMLCIITTTMLEEVLEPGTEDSVVVDFYAPATWWEHFKREHFPPWLLRRYPVRLLRYTREVSVKVTAAYPRAELLVPDEVGEAVIHARLEPGAPEPRDRGFCMVNWGYGGDVDNIVEEMDADDVPYVDWSNSRMEGP